MFTEGSLRGRDVDLVYNGGWENLINVTTKDGEAWPISVTLQADRQRDNAALPPSESLIEIELEWGARDGKMKSAKAKLGRGRTFTISAHTLKVRARNVGGGQTENWPIAHVSAHVAGGALTSLRPLSDLVEWKGVPLSNGASGGQKPIPAYGATYRVRRAPAVAVRLLWYGGANQQIDETWIARRERIEGVVVPLGAERVELVVDDGTPTSQASVEFDLALS